MNKHVRARCIAPPSHGIGIWPYIVGFVQILSACRAARNYQRLPEVVPTNRREPPEGARMQGKAWPGISIIVPARNEEANLPELLDSLVAQDYPSYEVLVVDDASTDSTAPIVRRYADRGVRLMQIDGPPQGWTGKNYACSVGATESIYPWLLFVDADTTLAPLALRSSLAFALEQKVSALSLFAQQRCETFWERLLLPFAYQQYFVNVNARRVHSAKGPALANGQYFLIQREAYQQAGGHAANAGSVVDDVALATSLKQIGVAPLACRGEALLSVRMYSSLRGIVEGFGKNSYLFLRQSPVTGVQTAASTSLAASVPMLFGDAWRKRSWRLLGLALIAYIVQVIGLRAWTRRFHIHPRYALLAPISAVSFLGIALSSMLRVLIGAPLPWKGRRYRASRSSQTRVRYRLPRQWFMQMGRALLSKTPRSIIEDSALAVSVLPNPPVVLGKEHIPAEGSFVLVTNHYQRLDLWIGWSGALMIDSIAQRRNDDLSVHVVTTDRARIGRFTVPGTRWIIERVAAVWDLVLVTPPVLANERAEKQRYSLLRMMRLLKRKDGRAACIIIMPEGDEGNTRGLIDALPGTGRALYALSTRGLPLVPAAVWEANGHLHANFGQPFSFEERNTSGPYASPTLHETMDDTARSIVMKRIAELLPPPLRGTYGSERIFNGTLG